MCHVTSATIADRTRLESQLILTLYILHGNRARTKRPHAGARAQGSESCKDVTVSGVEGLATTIELPASSTLYTNLLAEDDTVRGEYMSAGEEYLIW